jgi:hypothetical protein
VIDIEETLETGHGDWLGSNYDLVGKSLLGPEFGGPYVWIRRKSDGVLVLAR